MNPKFLKLETAHNAFSCRIDSNTNISLVTYFLKINAISRHPTEVVRLTDMERKYIKQLVKHTFGLN